MKALWVGWLLLSAPALADPSTLGPGQNPDLYGDRSGRLWLVFEKSGDIWLRSSADNGQTWSQEVAVCQTPAPSLHPNVVVDSHGAPQVLWLENERVVFSCSPDGRTFSAPVTLSPNRSDEPELAVDPQDGLHAVWVDLSTVSPDVTYSFSADQGRGWTSGVNLSRTPGVSSHPSVSAGSEKVRVAWVDTTSGTFRPDVFVVEGLAGVWSPPGNVSNTAGRSRAPRIVTNARGQVYLAWMDNSRSSSIWDIYFSRTRQDGSFTPPIFFDTPGESTDPSLAASETDRLAVAWVDSSQNSSNPDIFLAQSLDGGGTFTQPLNISQTSAPSTSPVLVFNQEQVVLVWQEQEAGGNVLRLALQPLQRKPRQPVGSGKY